MKKLANPSKLRDKFSVFVEMISEELKYLTPRQQIYTKELMYDALHIGILKKVWWWWNTFKWKFKRDYRNRWGMWSIYNYIYIYAYLSIKYIFIFIYIYLCIYIFIPIYTTHPFLSAIFSLIQNWNILSVWSIKDVIWLINLSLYTKLKWTNCCEKTWL